MASFFPDDIFGNGSKQEDSSTGSFAFGKKT